MIYCTVEEFPLDGGHAHKSMTLKVGHGSLINGSCHDASAHPFFLTSMHQTVGSNLERKTQPKTAGYL